MVTSLRHPLTRALQATRRLSCPAPAQLLLARHSSTLTHRGLATAVEPSSGKLRMIILGAPGELHLGFLRGAVAEVRV